MKKILMVSVMALLSVNTVFAAEVFGNWTTPDKKSVIEISDCGGSICGVVTKTAKVDQKDEFNSDESLRSRAIKGLQIFKFKDNGSGRKWEGDLYNTRDGKVYSGYIQLLDGDNAIELKGCWLFICSGETWTRI